MLINKSYRFVTVQELQEFHDAVRPVWADQSLELWSHYCVPVLNFLDRALKNVWGDNRKGMSGVY